MYFFSDENGDGVGTYLPVDSEDSTKMDISTFNPSGQEGQVAFDYQLHFHINQSALDGIIDETVASIHHHNNISSLNNISESFVNTLSQIGEDNGLPT